MLAHSVDLAARSTESQAQVDLLNLMSADKILYDNCALKLEQIALQLSTSSNLSLINHFLLVCESATQNILLKKKTKPQTELLRNLGSVSEELLFNCIVFSKEK